MKLLVMFFITNLFARINEFKDKELYTVWKVSKYGVFSGHLSVFSPYTGKYGPEKTPYLDAFHAVIVSSHLSGMQTIFVLFLYYSN